jgi:hypothetical protein
VFLLVQSEPGARETAPPVQTSDAQLFAELYSAAESEEPRAADPIRGLFEEAP